MDRLHTSTGLIFQDYRIGDVVGVWANAFEDAVLHLESPYSPVFHHLLVGPYVPEDRDWIILESITSGVRIGRLSWYRGKMAMVYRPPESVSYETEIATIRYVYHPDIGRIVFDAATKYGRKRYDYFQLARLLIWGVPKLIRNGFRPIPYYQIPGDNDDALICTELVVRAYSLYWPIVSDGVAATPAAIYAAFLNEKLDLVYKGEIIAGSGQGSWVRNIKAKLVKLWKLICRA